MHHNNSARNDFVAKPENSSVRATAPGIDGTTRCSIVVQAGVTFTRSLLDAVRRCVQKGVRGVSIDAIASQSDEETLELIGTLGQQSDAFALLGTVLGGSPNRISLAVATALSSDQHCRCCSGERLATGDVPGGPACVQ